MKELDFYEYPKYDNLLKTIPLNTLFARSVAKHYISGRIYVNDNLSSPSTFYIAHPYGMSLLFGQTDHPKFNEALTNYLLNKDKKRVKPEWLQVYPSDWSQRLEEILGHHLVRNNQHVIDDEEKVVEYTRVNFKFNLSRYNEFKKKKNLPPNFSINTKKDYIFENMQGAVVPRNFWDNAEDFIQRAIAYGLIQNEKIISTSFSSFLVERDLEIGIETLEGYRGQGLAFYACSLLIDYCLEHGFEPVWACREDNHGSYGLALSLGFKPAVSIPYYKLVV